MKPRLLAPATASAKGQAAGRLGFAFGRRFFLLVGLAALWIIPAFWDWRFLLAMAGIDALAVLAFIADLLRLPPAELLVLERSWTGPASLNNPVEVVVQLQNLSGSALHCDILDDVPATLRKTPATLGIKVAARDSATYQYTVHPLQRGDVTVGNAYLRYRSTAGFAERWARAELTQKVRVLPDLEEAKKQNIYMARARQIELQKRLVRQRGTGREFESLREYQQGDEFRNICWTATARRGKHVTRLFQVERNQAVWLVIDAGRLLRAKVGELSKLDLAANAGLSLAQVALYSGDRVGLLVYGRKIQQQVGAGRGLQHLRVIMDNLASAREEAAEADHLFAAASLLRLQKQRALIIWITDLADTSMTPEVVESASQILSKHLLLFTVMAQSDLTALAGKVPGNAAEMYEVVAAQEIVQRRESLLLKVRERGALALEVTPGRLTTTLVNQYLEIKERSLI